MNLQSQKFKLSADMCSSGTDRSPTLVDSSPLPPDVSICQTVKTFTAHFVLHMVCLGTVSDSKEIYSSSVFGGRKRAVAILAIWQWLKILNISIIVSCTISWDVQHFGIHVQLANHKAILCIQFIVFLSQVVENICLLCVWHFGMHVQWTNPIAILCIQFNVFISQVG